MTQQERWNQLTEPLLAWYAEHRRILPWREEVSAYRTWVSEIMLQQTRVTAVLPYFARFQAELPTVADLAAVEEERLLKLWEGLGYYRRARNLQRAARQIMDGYGGAFPSTYPELLKLAGIGEYTAGAIASIAFGEAVPAVDGNVLRLVARICGDARDMQEPSVRRSVRERVAEGMSRTHAGAYNQALMDLGATVCLPNGSPLCEDCPAQGFCLACAEGRQRELPLRAPKKARRIEEKTVFVLWREDTVALHRRSQTGLLAGLWEFPNAEGTLGESAAAEYLQGQGLVPLAWEQCLQAQHTFSHVEWHMTGYVLRVRGTGAQDWRWQDASGFAEAPLPSAFARYRRQVLERWKETKDDDL